MSKDRIMAGLSFKVGNKTQNIKKAYLMIVSCWNWKSLLSTYKKIQFFVVCQIKRLHRLTFMDDQECIKYLIFKWTNYSLVGEVFSTSTTDEWLVMIHDLISNILQPGEVGDQFLDTRSKIWKRNVSQWSTSRNFSW